MQLKWTGFEKWWLLLFEDGGVSQIVSGWISALFNEDPKGPILPLRLKLGEPRLAVWINGVGLFDLKLGVIS